MIDWNTWQRETGAGAEYLVWVIATKLTKNKVLKLEWPNTVFHWVNTQALILGQRVKGFVVVGRGGGVVARNQTLK